MKVGIATTLSIAGVLAAGAAAFVVNTSVLSSTNAPVTTSVASAPNSVPTATPAPGSVVALNTAVVEQNPSSTTSTYAVGDSGTVVIDTSTGRAVITSVAPAAGWTSEYAQANADGAVKVRFAQASSRIEFTAQMVNGIVQTSVTNETAPAVKEPKPKKPRYSDDDHDDEDEDEHEDKEEHERDDDERDDD
jgi:hypothetical protein